MGPDYFFGEVDSQFLVALCLWVKSLAQVEQQHRKLMLEPIVDIEILLFAGSEQVFDFDCAVFCVLTEYVEIIVVPVEWFVSTLGALLFVSFRAFRQTDFISLGQLIVSIRVVREGQSQLIQSDILNSCRREFHRPHDIGVGQQFIFQIILVVTILSMTALIITTLASFLVK